MKFLENIDKFLIVFLLVLFTGVIIAFQGNKKDLLRQIDDLQVELAQSGQKVDTFIIRDSIPVFRERIVEVDRSDYKSILADRKLIKDLELKISEIEAENRTLMSTRDTVVLNPIGDSALTYRDKWAFFHVNLYSRVLDWEVRDSLVTFVSTDYRHHFLWWKWGKRGYNVTLVNFNQKSRIVYNKYIKVK